METKFKVGNVVRLKSGGPPMVVSLDCKRMQTQNGDFLDTVWCVWFDKNDVSHAQAFHPDTLIPNSQVE